MTKEQRERLEQFVNLYWGWEAPLGDTAINVRALLAAFDAAQRDANEALDLLASIYGLYEDGADVYEEPEECAGYCGKAIQLPEDEEERIIALLNRLRPVTAAIAATNAQAGGEG